MSKQLIFKKYDGTIINDVNKYVKEFIDKNPYTEITIGCDSQAHARTIYYSIAIVMHVFNDSKESNPKRAGNGAHVISATIIDRDKNLKSDIYTKLWAETTYAIETAQLLKDCNTPIKIHLDYNSKQTEYSNILYASGIGYAASHGFEALGKPYAWASTHVADNLCRKSNK